jgi:predicted subunit of tRNA(5-methylaminomethyl-2-thiouridylate) methyltransferase
MDAGLCFSGGKDSALAALVLKPFYDVTLVCGTFGITDDADHAAEAAAALGFPFERLDLDEAAAHEAVERMLADGYPRRGIQHVHDHALERLADQGFDAIADGTRRDDRVPTVSRAQAQSLEDRYDVDYLAPLSGFGRNTVDDLVTERLKVEVGPSQDLPKGDYEAELRALLREEYDMPVSEIFPDHDQTRVVGLQE